MINKSKIIDLIKKYADGDDDAPPARPRGAKKTPISNDGVPSRPGTKLVNTNAPVANLKEIKIMQQSIQKVVEAVKNSSQEFLTFMIKQYKIDPTSISSIGKNEVFADGIWGKKTQQSLDAISRLSVSLIKTSHEFGGTTRQSWNETDHNSFVKLIKVSDNKEKNENATSIAALLDKLADFYQNYSRQVTQTNTFKKISDPNGVIFSVSNSAPNTLVDEQGTSLLNDPAFLSQRIDANLPSANGNMQTKISLLDMFDKNRFQKFLQQTLKYDDAQSKNVQLQTTILNMIRQQVQPLIKNNPEAAAATAPPTNKSEVM